MATLLSLVTCFTDEERRTGNLLDAEAVLAQALAATRFYAGYAQIAPEITPDTEITLSAWALIRPLFLLYLERETALQLEASRGLGLDVFGRSSSEIAADINQAEAEMPHRAFCQEIITV